MRRWSCYFGVYFPIPRDTNANITELLRASKDNLHTSTPCRTHIVQVLMMTLQPNVHFYGTRGFSRGCVKSVSNSLDAVFIHRHIQDRLCMKDVFPPTITTALLIKIYLVLVQEDSTTRSPTDFSVYSHGVSPLTFSIMIYQCEYFVLYGV